MAFRNVFVAQSIRQKLLFGTLFLAIIPIAVTSLLLGRESVSSGRGALEAQSRESLIAQRAAKASQITDYFDSLSNQVQVLAASPEVVNAMRELPNAYDNSVISIADLPTERARLAKYYIGDFMQEFEKRNTGRKLDVASTVAQLPDLAMNLQYHYIAANQNPLGAKNSLDKANDGSRYSELHGALHPFLRTALRQFGLYDIFLVDPRNGNVVYTVFKELDFATSLVSGPYAKTRLGDAFRQSWALDRAGQVALSEFGEYLPSYNDQAAFLGTPIFDNGKKIGVLIVQVPIDKINSVMTADGRWKEQGMGDTGETYLVSAADGTPRSVARQALEDIQGYAKSVGDAGFARGVVNAVTTKGTGIGLVPIKTQATQEAFEKGATGFGVYPNYANVQVLGAYAPLSVLGLRWAIVSEIHADEAFASVTVLRDKVFVWSVGLFAGLLVLGLLIAYALLRSVTNPITKMQDTVTAIANGDFNARSELGGDDEFGQLSRAFDNLLDDRVARLADAERENEDLNNSVVQLLQAVAQLSNKDLTAKAPVSANVIGTVSDSINLLAHETGRVLSEVTSIAAQVKLSTERVKRQGESVTATAAAAEKALAGRPRFESVDGSAEATGLGSAGADLVIAAQAFHWFDPVRARVEFARILRPAGLVALVWNQRRDSQLNRAYLEMLERFASDYALVRESQRSSEDKMRAFFAPVAPRMTTFDNEQRLDEAGFEGRLLSSSYAPPRGDPMHAPILARAAEIFREHSQGGLVTIAYDTIVWYGGLA